MQRVHSTWTNNLWITLKALQSKGKKSFHSIILQLDRTRFFLKHPRVKSRGPVHCVFAEVKIIFAVKIFKGFLPKNSEAVIVNVIILVGVKKFCSVKSEQTPERYGVGALLNKLPI